ncbi:DUF6942 family protein [Motilimonas pumila]|uniref:DUF6942 family protein n=1 Tax=Motilimonas pumila TaxID=2303987 RepID=UPI0011C36668|nr:hypothetical protein [Motilimonas pumila]
MAVNLPNAPVLPRGYSTLDDTDKYQAIINENGNHWRKILIIISKIMAGKDWRDYRYQSLFSGEVQWQFLSCQTTPSHQQNHKRDPLTGKVSTSAAWSLHAGKLTWLEQDFDPETSKSAQCINSQFPCYLLQQKIFSPYLDYRQLPNALTEHLHQLVKN